VAVDRKPTVLIVGKYYDPGKGFKDALESSGYETVSLSDPQEIFDRLAGRRLAMAIVGVTTTVELCESIIREIKKLKLKLPVVVVSTLKDIHGKEKLIELGVQEWMTQPFDMDYVKRRLKELLRA